MSRRRLALALIVLLFGVSFLALPELPDRVPIHWNAAGDPDAWADAWLGAFLLPLGALAVWGLLVGIRMPMGPEERAAADRFLDTMLLAFAILWSAIHGVVLADYLGWPLPLDVSGLCFLAVGAFLAWTGRWMARMADSEAGLVLVNLPTDDPEVKQEILRKGGAMMVGLGAIMALAAAFGARGRLLLLAAGFLPVGLGFPVWALWKAARSR